MSVQAAMIAESVKGSVARAPVPGRRGLESPVIGGAKASRRAGGMQCAQIGMQDRRQE